MRKSKLTGALLSTAAGVAITSAAFAQDADVFPQVNVEDGQSYLASDLMGRRVYGVEQEYEANAAVAANSAAEWDDIGEIGDMIVGTDGSIEAVIVDVGGFLGIGEREVAVSWDAIRPVTEDDDPNEVFLTVPATQEQLEGAPEFTRTTAAGTVDSDGEQMVSAEGETEVEQEAEEVAVETDAAMENAEQEVEEAAAATGEAVEGAAEEVQEETAEAAEATGDAVEAAGDEVEEEMAEAEAEVEEMDATETVVVEGSDPEQEAEQPADMTAEGGTEVETEGQQIEVVEGSGTEEVPAADAEVVAEETATDVEGGTLTTEAEMAEGGAMDRTVLRTPAVEREGYEVVGMDQLTVEDLTGARVYGINDEDIGEIDDLLLSEDGSQIDGAILGIGGFLGLGEHRIALTMEELQILRSEGDFRVYVDATQEELEAQPEYEGAS